MEHSAYQQSKLVKSMVSGVSNGLKLGLCNFLAASFVLRPSSVLRPVLRVKSFNRNVGLLKKVEIIMVPIP